MLILPQIRLEIYTNDERKGGNIIHLLFKFLFRGGVSRFHGGSPCPEKSRNFRYEMVRRIMEALSSCDVMAAGSGSIFANS